MLGALEDVAIVMVKEEHLKILVELKFLDHQRLHAPELEYLTRIMESNPITACLVFHLLNNNSNDSNNISVDAYLNFPNSMQTSKNVEIPKCQSDAMILFDYLPFVETKMCSSWLLRKQFIRTLQKIAKVVEYDAVDFSTVSMALKLRNGNLFTVCLLEIRLNHHFPPVPAAASSLLPPPPPLNSAAKPQTSSSTSSAMFPFSPSGANIFSGGKIKSTDSNTNKSKSVVHGVGGGVSGSSPPPLGMPLFTVFDIQTAQCNPIDSIYLLYDPTCQTPDTYARELYYLACEKIFSQAFGIEVRGHSGLKSNRKKERNSSALK